jgi:NitT/TauT family transport system permease protein
MISKLSIIILWVVLSRIVNNEVIIPSINSTFISMIEIIKGPDFLNIIKYTLYRTLMGFSISLLLAMLIGVVSSFSKIIYNFMDPISKILNSVPTIALIVLALIWLDNELVPIFVGFIIVFPLLYETVLNSILNVNQEIIQMSQLYKVGTVEVLKNIYIPNVLYNLSHIFTSVIGINLKMVIAGEVLSQPKYAIGSSLQLQRMYLNTSGVFAWIVMILLISGIINYLGIALKYSLRIDKWT